MTRYTEFFQKILSLRHWNYTHFIENFIKLSYSLRYSCAQYFCSKVVVLALCLVRLSSKRLGCGSKKCDCAWTWASMGHHFFIWFGHNESYSRTMSLINLAFFRRCSNLIFTSQRNNSTMQDDIQIWNHKQRCAFIYFLSSLRQPASLFV